MSDDREAALHLAARRCVEAMRADSEEIARRLELPMPTKPKGEELAFPTDLTMVGDDALGTHLGYWAGLVGFAKTQAAILGGAATIAKVDADREFNVKFYYRTEQSSTIRRHNTGAQNAVIESRRLSARLRADATFVDALLAGYEAKYAALSRELTRRASRSG